MSKSHEIIVRMGALLTLLTLFVVDSAVASVPPVEAPTVTVQYRDLNLSAPEGVASLYQRIRNAAAEVCKPVEGPQLVNRLFWREWNDCFDHAIAGAVQTVHNEKLSAYHWEHIRGPRHSWVEARATAAAQ